MFNYLSSENRAEVFIQYLNRLVAEHYGALYPRRKDSPVDENLLSLNSILGIVLYACAGKFPYPERDIAACPMEAQRQLPPAETIYKDWIKQSLEGMVTLYCDYIDRLVEILAYKKNPNRLLITCSISPRRLEIIEKLHAEIEKGSAAVEKHEKFTFIDSD